MLFERFEKIWTYVLAEVLKSFWRQGVDSGCQPPETNLITMQMILNKRSTWLLFFLSRHCRRYFRGELDHERLL